MFSSYHVIWYDPVQTKLNQVSAKLLPIKVHLCGSKWVLPISDRRFSISILAIDNKKSLPQFADQECQIFDWNLCADFCPCKFHALVPGRVTWWYSFETWLLSTFELWQKSSNRHIFTKEGRKKIRKKRDDLSKYSASAVLTQTRLTVFFFLCAQMSLYLWEGIELGSVYAWIDGLNLAFLVHILLWHKLFLLTHQKVYFWKDFNEVLINLINLKIKP